MNGPEQLVPLRRPDRLFIDGQWVQPSTQASFDVIEAATKKLFFRVAQAKEADLSRAVGAARNAFDSGPWPQLTHAHRAGYLRAIATAVGERVDDFAQLWPRESGIVHGYARMRLAGMPQLFTYYADLPTTSRSRSG